MRRRPAEEVVLRAVLETVAEVVRRGNRGARLVVAAGVSLVLGQHLPDPRRTPSGRRTVISPALDARGRARGTYKRLLWPRHARRLVVLAVCRDGTLAHCQSVSAAAGDFASEEDVVHLVAVSLAVLCPVNPVPGTQASALGTLAEVRGNGINSFARPDTSVVDTDDCHVAGLEGVHVGGVCDSDGGAAEEGDVGGLAQLVGGVQRAVVLESVRSASLASEGRHTSQA